jgi:hypothetical protein
MTTGQIKDYIREHFGRVGIPTFIIDLALEASRLQIEQQGNFWWMAAASPATWDLVVDDGDYTIASSGGDITIAKFKDIRALHYKLSTDTQWIEVEVGPDTKNELDLQYADGSDGSPEYAVLEDSTLYIYPQDPQYAYNMRMYYWRYTTMGGNTAEDTITKEFPMALIYGALQHGYELELKDIQGASYWRKLLGGEPFGSGGEIVKIRRENLKRSWHDKIDFVPHVGGGRRNRRLDNMKIYR